MLLQPLVENSIKYAVAVSEMGGIITIKATLEDGQLCIRVTDDGPEVELLDNGKIASTYGVGMQYIRDRLLEIYGTNHQLGLKNVQPHGLEVSIYIPYELEP